MKNLQRFGSVVVLMLTLTLPSAAGEISMPGATSSTSQRQSSLTGDINIPGATATGEIPTPGALDPVTEAVLSLLQGLMSLF